MRSALVGLSTALVVASCGSGAADPVATLPNLSTTKVATSLLETTTSERSTSTTEVLTLCAPAEFFPEVLPIAAAAETPNFADVPFDEFTIIPGAWIAMRNTSTGAPVMVLIRGALPPVQFTDDIEPIEILNGVPAALGPLEDGFWAVAWAMSPDERCDLYSLIFYPPTSADEARAVAVSLTEGAVQGP